MPNTNIQGLNYSDNQSQLVDKLNNNFDEIVELHGGSQGTPGPTGDRGAIGDSGTFGPTGLDGERGTRWFVSSVAPAGSAQEGDYWINSTSSDIYTLQLTGWNPTGYNIRTGGDLFRVDNFVYNGGSTYSGGTGTAIQMSQVLPKNYLFILSDVTPESGVINELLSKFSISNDSTVNDSPLLEFSRSELADGSIADYSLHPFFYWPSSIPTENSLGLSIPGGTFQIGASGGFTSSFGSLNMDSQKGTEIDYGVDSTSGIYSTGGYNINAAGNFIVTSKYLNISGLSGGFLNPLFSVSTLASSSPHIAITPSGTAGFRSTRTGDIHSTLSQKVYHLKLEDSTGNQFSLSTRGKLKMNKTIESISYPSTIAGTTGISGGSSTIINWYFISRTSSTVGSALDNGNTMIINPAVVSGQHVGLGLYNDSDFGWGGSGGLQMGESINITVHNSSDAAPGSSATGFKFIGVGTGASASCVTKVTLPFLAPTVELTIARGVTGTAVTTVYYRAYAPWSSGLSLGSTGGSGGSFTY
jgi:hypothetical protein